MGVSLPLSRARLHAVASLMFVKLYLLYGCVTTLLFRFPVDAAVCSTLSFPQLNVICSGRWALLSCLRMRYVPNTTHLERQPFCVIIAPAVLSENGVCPKTSAPTQVAFLCNHCISSSA